MELTDRTVVQEIEFSGNTSHGYIEQLLDTLPAVGRDDPDSPEWKATPVRELDLSGFGYNGVIYVKDESQNPTKTLKDRKAWELGPILHRAWAHSLWQQHLNGTLEQTKIPRLSEITAGNSGLAQIDMNEQWNLPPPKILLDSTVPEPTLDRLRDRRADIYLADLSINMFTGKREPYTAEQIRILTNNVGGHDITSSRILNRDKDFYDWHWHEIFNESPGEVYGPFGSGEWFANGITWQRETSINGDARKDVRLDVKPESVSRISILAAEPAQMVDSQADKLTGQKPFLVYGENDLQGMRSLSFTGSDTGVYRVPETKIELAHGMMSLSGIDAEPSASVGLALYLDRFERGLVDKDNKVLVVNTGRGI